LAGCLRAPPRSWTLLLALAGIFSDWLLARGEDTMMDELWQKSACELAEGIARRQFSCGEVMASVAERIRAKNKALNAIVYDYTEEALAEARHADEDLAAGRRRGPLHGVPVTIKENVDQRGKPTPNGLPAFETVIAPDDAPVVANLRRAGAIIVG